MDRAQPVVPVPHLDMAQQIAVARSHLDGWRCLADLVGHADIPSEVIEALTEILVFPEEEPWPRAVTHPRCRAAIRSRIASPGG